MDCAVPPQGMAGGTAWYCCIVAGRAGCNLSLRARVLGGSLCLAGSLPLSSVLCLPARLPACLQVDMLFSLLLLSALVIISFLQVGACLHSP